MRIQLSDHFTLRRLIRFVIPSVAMMIFTSIYGVVDGFFISNYAGKIAFAAVNLIIPMQMMLGAIGFMFGTGGAAIVGRLLGEGKPEGAKKAFSLFVYTTFIIAFILVIIMQICLIPLSRFAGATDNMLPYCVMYGRVTFCSLPCFMLQTMYQTFFVTAEKPTLGLSVTIIAGVMNMVLDFVLVGVFKLGVVGAGIATVTSETTGALLPTIYFLRKNNSLLQLTTTRFDFGLLVKCTSNGVSELMGNISSSLINMIYNVQLLRYIGEDGVASYGVIMYMNFIFTAIFWGYAIGSAPVVSFNYGAKNDTELKNIFKKSLGIVCVCGAILFSVAMVFASDISKIFVGYDTGLWEMTTNAFRTYSISFLFCGINIFGSSFFTALNNGVVSAAISFLRTFVFQVICVLGLPVIIGVNGIWLSITIAEILTLGITFMCVVKNRKRYNYI
ncbi:MAG: MATE family efflux transporter [Clostridia bacterium]|nr:MATE family efflux transporter [Clostridia bacterium]